MTFRMEDLPAPFCPPKRERTIIDREKQLASRDVLPGGGSHASPRGTSLPGLTRQSIRFAKTRFAESFVTKKMDARVTPAHEGGPSVMRLAPERAARAWCSRRGFSSVQK